MFCWLNRQDKKFLQETNARYNIPIIFSRNFNDFLKRVEKNDYIVVSCSSLSNKYSKIETLVRQHNTKIFHIFVRQNMNGRKELDFMCEPNVVSRQYEPSELIEEFLEQEDYTHLDDYPRKIWNDQDFRISS